jgi:lipopolysaccharide transport system ATP-binding protein
MAGDFAIRVEGLSKRFRLGETVAYRTLRESLMRGLAGALRAPSEHAEASLVWALRDVDLTVDRGEVVGIIGANGAGKSTLLKILSRITAPTHGRAEIRGRVGSLLEVGTGFHPELTGRENVYLNGAILGMRKAEIDAKFDAIAAFSGVERFLDTPVKRYSSGMHVRLAFAVAAHLEPEILILDEVLAVGDAAFQKSCLQKIGDVAEGGRTVLFVSHNMKAVRRLCTRSVWLAEGQVAASGPTEEVIAAYLRSAQQIESLEEVSTLLDELPPDAAFRLLDVCVRQGGVPTTSPGTGDPIEIELVYEVSEPTRGLRVYFDLCDTDRERLVRSFHDDDADAVAVVPPGRYRAVATIPADLLAPQDYVLILRGTIDEVRNVTGPGVAIPLRVSDTSRINRAYPHQPSLAKLRPVIPWKTEVIL